MSQAILIEPITATAFAPFGDLLDCSGAADMRINQGLCERFHDRAALDAGGARVGISLFQAQLRALPYQLDMMERHPLGTQAFIPMDSVGFLVIVAADAGGKPGHPRAFQTAPGQAINFHRNIWHGVLTPIAGNGLFAVIDRIGTGNNLEEFWFETPYVVASPN